jgi:hypothetical protein
MPHAQCNESSIPFNNDGKPCRGSDWFISGRIDGVFWGSQGGLDNSGKLAVLAPLGLEMAQLSPDEKIKLTAAAEGFEPKSDILTLPEGVTRELTLTLKPK